MFLHNINLLLIFSLKFTLCRNIQNFGYPLCSLEKIFGVFNICCFFRIQGQPNFFWKTCKIRAFENCFFISPPQNFKNRSKCGLFFLKGFTVTFDKKKQIFATSQNFFSYKKKVKKSSKKWLKKMKKKFFSKYFDGQKQW